MKENRDDPKGITVTAITVTERPAELTTVPGAAVQFVARNRGRDMTEREMNAKTRVYVADALAHADDLVLAALDRAEENLPKASRFAERRANRRVNDLYDALNARVGKVSARLAADAIDHLIESGVIEGEGYVKHKPRFSRTAGCSCGCSPGVVVGTRFRRTNTRKVVDIYLSPATPVSLTKAGS